MCLEFREEMKFGDRDSWKVFETYIHNQIIRKIN